MTWIKCLSIVQWLGQKKIVWKIICLAGLQKTRFHLLAVHMSGSPQSHSSFPFKWDWSTEDVFNWQTKNYCILKRQNDQQPQQMKYLELSWKDLDPTVPTERMPAWFEARVVSSIFKIGSHLLLEILIFHSYHFLQNIDFYLFLNCEGSQKQI